jgi:predicted amidohydrolase YtcJ
VDAATALAASTDGGSHTGSALFPGDVADLVVVDRDPLSADEASLRQSPGRP